MTKLPDDIKEIFFRVLYGNMDILDFEQWLYSNKEIEGVLRDEDYLDLIAFGYKEKRAKYELIPLLKKHIENSEYEKWRLQKMLTAVLNKEPKTPEVLSQFYDMYCHGYKFLDVLAMKYGLTIEVPPRRYNTKNWDGTWEDLTTIQQQKIVDSFYPKIKDEVIKVMEWLDNGTVVPMDKKNEFDHIASYAFIDNRKETEKDRMLWKPITLPTTKKSNVSKLLSKVKKLF